MSKVDRRSPPERPTLPSMGYQPGLDGLRAISVIAVIFYHAGFEWMHGGFFGVEVFFVVSGFLITSLLIEERGRTGGVSLRQFWVRRIRRLFPALFTMLLVVSTWTALFGSAEQTSQMRRDLPWSIFYVANWGQIVGDVPYFQAGDPPLLRHLWSLAVEEQWYLLWPLAFVLLVRSGWKPLRTAKFLLGVVGVVVVLTWWIQRGDPGPIEGGLFDGDNRVNFNYLSTVTRSGGLLLGAAAAFVWRPWRSPHAHRAPSRPLDLAMGISLGLLICSFIAARLTEGYMYPWLLTAVSLLSLVAVLVVVHPGAAGSRLILSWNPLVEVGKRSYGLYLWHWPIFVIAGATDGSTGKFLAASVVSIVASEACYRYIETPVRKGALSTWWRSRQQFPWAPVGGAAAVGLALVVFYVSVEPFDVAAGGDDVAFDLAVITTEPGTAQTTQPAVTTPVGSQETAPLSAPDPAAPDATTTEPAPVVTPPVLPRSLSIVGDSQAHSLAINLPSGIESTFTIEDGSLDGCSVYDSGRVHSSRESFNNSFSICRDWLDAWANAARGTEVALVVLGAWDVFDVEIDGVIHPFASADFDRLFTTNLGTGVDTMTATGAKVALLEMACMRPQDVDGAGVPALPERGDDARVAHLNELQRSVAAGRPDVTFVEGPDEWCGDEQIASDLGYRWDGVHVYKPGANLIYETIAPALLAIPV
jgi:peptidoglycan/LPS O-acetylase OafA/YrhL